MSREMFGEEMDGSHFGHRSSVSDKTIKRMERIWERYSPSENSIVTNL